MHFKLSYINFFNVMIVISSIFMAFNGEFLKCIINEKPQNIKFNGTVKELLEKLGFNEQIVLVKLNGTIVTELDELNDKDTVEIQKVILGG